MLFLPQNLEILLLLAVMIFLLRRAVRRPQKDANLWLPVIVVVVSVPISVLSWQIMKEAARNSSPGGIVFGLLFGWFAFVGLLAAVILTMRLLVKGGLLKPRDQLPQRTPRPVVRRYWFWVLVVIVGCYLILVIGRGLLVLLDESLQAFEQRRARSTATAEVSCPPEELVHRKDMMGGRRRRGCGSCGKVAEPAFHRFHSPGGRRHLGGPHERGASG